MHVGQCLGPDSTERGAGEEYVWCGAGRGVAFGTPPGYL